jgi:enamine deaminase RidA (YjgF/YER057c/UK114 family)
MKMIQGLAEEQRLSGAIVQDGLVWLAGRVADDDSPDTGGQTADVLRQVDALLEQAGTHKRRPLSVTAVLADVRDAPAVNRPWDGSPDPATKPTRTTVEAALVAPSWPVGITGVAALDGPGARRT